MNIFISKTHPLQKNFSMQDPKHDEENHIKNLAGIDAIKKLKDMAEDARICMFSTFNGSRPDPTRPMALQQVDEAGKLYFFSAISSNKNKEIAADPEVQITFSNSGNSEYLSIYGTAIINQDKQKIDELWNNYAKVWFQDGKDDPSLTLITVTPNTCEYWDTKHNKMVQWAKMAASLATGKTMDDGVEGQLQV